jgi:hypothetical protein
LRHSEDLQQAISNHIEGGEEEEEEEEEENHSYTVTCMTAALECKGLSHHHLECSYHQQCDIGLSYV